MRRTNRPLVLEDLPEPEVGTRDVRVRIAASGICHTDLNVIEGKSARSLPIVPCHEACGTVEAVGDDVRRVKVGDRVLALGVAGVRQWLVRTNGMSNHCERGSFVQQTKRVALADGRQAGALCGCGVTTGVGAALNTAKVTPGSSVAVIGCGGVGRSVAAWRAPSPSSACPPSAPLRAPALRATVSGKRLQGSAVGGSQILRDFLRHIRLAESGKIDLASMVSRRISLDEVNDGIATLQDADGVRTVIV